MEKFVLSNDINTVCLTAKSFPDGIMEAHKTIHTAVPFSSKRKYFGISRPENGVIVYKAAAELLAGETAESFQLDTFVLEKGTYVVKDIANFTKNIPAIDQAFKELIRLPDIASNGYCVEWYISENDVRCMVRLED